MDKVKSLSKGVGISIILTIILILFFSFLLVKTNIKEQYINTIIIVISSISILIGTSISTISLKKHGIINGILISVIYMVVLYIISSAVCGDFSIKAGSIIMFFIGVVLGILGGIIGVNIKS